MSKSTFCVLRYAHVRYVKSLNANIQKQYNEIKIASMKFSGYYFYMNTNIQGYFQICISVPLIKSF